VTFFVVKIKNNIVKVFLTKLYKTSEVVFENKDNVIQKSEMTLKELKQKCFKGFFKNI
jgi:hypothetical protein